MAKRVAVIGAGPSGLAALRLFALDEQVKYDVICFEQLSDVGGLWIYSDVINDVNHPTGTQYTAVYKNLKTNLPRQILKYTDYDYPDHLPSYIHHTEVLKYLQGYCDHFNLKRFVRFNMRVKQVAPRSVMGQDDVWDVSVQNISTNQIEEFVFDVIIVSTGHFTIPVYPKIKGLEKFEGTMIHSQCYRDPEDYKGKRVLVIGGSFSGEDVASEVCNYAEKTWISHLKEKTIALPDKVEQVGEITSIVGRKATLLPRKTTSKADETSKDLEEHSKLGNVSKDGNEVGKDKILNIDNIDVIICCTGFTHSYPFLNADCGVAVLASRSVGPLYKVVISLSRPTLAFTCFPTLIPAFPLAEYQLKFFKSHLEGRMTIPNFAKDKLTDEEWKSLLCLDLLEDPNKIDLLSFPYLDELAALGGFEPLPPYFAEAGKEWYAQRAIAIPGYKTKEYKIVDGKHLVEVTK